MPFSLLNKDVVLEIFLHHIAIDLDGPFALMLVCRNWRDLVIFNARMWTWVVIDDSQPDWNHKAHVAVTLSRDLPIQLVLRTPSPDIDRLLDIIPRCRTAFLDTSKWSGTFSGGAGMVTHEEFVDSRSQFLELHTVVSNTLNTLERRGIKAFVESTNGACYSYTTWTIYERVYKAKTLEDQLADIPLHLITVLIFEDKPKRTPRRIRLLNIWTHLASFPYLRSLEISDNFIGVDNPSAVPKISLPSLQNLAIDCVTGWHFRRAGSSFDLFSLLSHIHAPELREVILYGSVNQLITAVGMEVDGVHPSSLTLSFLSIEDTELHMTLYPGPIFIQLQQLKLDFFEPKWSSIKWDAHMLERLLQEIQILVKSVPEQVVMTFHGGDELYHIIQLDMPGIQALDIVYRTGDFDKHSSPLPPTTPRFRSVKFSSGSPVNIPLFQSAQNVIVEAADLDVWFNALNGSATMTALDVGISTMESHSSPHRCSFTPPYRDRFRYLTRLRMTAEVMKTFIEHFEMHNLQEITLCKDESGGIGPFEALLHAISIWGDFQGRLEVLKLEAFPPWEPLLRFVATFGKLSGKGISTVLLPGLPNPSMLHALVEALENSSEDYTMVLNYMGEPEVLGCRDCVGGGWTCHEDVECTRFSPDTVVTITKETYVGRYRL